MRRALALAMLVAGCVEDPELEAPDAGELAADARARPDARPYPDAREDLPDADLTCWQTCPVEVGYCWWGECKHWPTFPPAWECSEEYRDHGSALACCKEICRDACAQIPPAYRQELGCPNSCTERCKEVLGD